MGPSSEGALSEDEKEEARTAAVEYCREKYSIEVELVDSDINERGIMKDGYLPAESYKGVPVSVSYGEERFVVDVCGDDTTDDRSRGAAFDLLKDYLASELGASSYVGVDVRDVPSGVCFEPDGSNVAEAAAACGDLHGSVLVAEGQNVSEKLPAGFSQVQVLYVRPEMNPDEVGSLLGYLWAVEPECCTPYLSRYSLVTDAGVSSKQITDDDIAYWGSDFMERYFEATPGGRLFSKFTGEKTIGDELFCRADAPTFGDTNTVPVFFTQEQWDELTQGYHSTSYNIVLQDPEASFVMHGERTSGTSSIQVRGLDSFGDYLVAYCTPNARLLFLGVPR